MELTFSLLQRCDLLVPQGEHSCESFCWIRPQGTTELTRRKGCTTQACGFVILLSPHLSPADRLPLA